MRSRISLARLVILTGYFASFSAIARAAELLEEFARPRVSFFAGDK
jgi:hypothetical protein